MLGGLPDLLQYYIRGGGGLGQFITILHGGGSSETPKLYYVIYEQPLITKMFLWSLALFWQGRIHWKTFQGSSANFSNGWKVVEIGLGLNEELFI